MDCKIGVLIVEDSPAAKDLLEKIFSLSPDFQVLGWAKNGAEAMKLVPELQPDLVTMDIYMDHMNGPDAVEWIMINHPTPIIVLTSSPCSDLAFSSIQRGALEILPKPSARLLAEHKERELFLREMRILSKVKVVSRHIMKKTRPSILEKTIIGIASSTGGPVALAQVLKGLPRDIPASIIIVQHISREFDKSLADWLSTETGLPVELAVEGEVLREGKVYLAPVRFHLEVDSERRIRLLDGPPVNGIKPSATVLFKSLAKNISSQCIGIVLTGMGDDGASGLEDMFRKGSYIIAQDESTSVVFGMPKVAIDRGIVHEVLPAGDIPKAVLRRLGWQKA